MIALIREAGIVGHGGAAFPTHVKIRSALGKVDTMIVNAAECEPYITSDHRVMLEYADDVIAGVRILLRIFSRIRCIIAVEKQQARRRRGAAPRHRRGQPHQDRHAPHKVPAGR